MMSNLLDNPEILRSMIASNPQMQAMMDANPQIRHVLNDPSILRQSMEVMRNPAAMQQMMRSQDLAMSQLENIPGGFNALRRMYEDVQEPMMDAMNSAPSHSSPSATAPATPPSANPNTSALPNPWGAPQQQQQARRRHVACLQDVLEQRDQPDPDPAIRDRANASLRFLRSQLA